MLTAGFEPLTLGLLDHALPTRPGLCCSVDRRLDHWAIGTSVFIRNYFSSIVTCTLCVGCKLLKPHPLCSAFSTHLWSSFFVFQRP